MIHYQLMVTYIHLQLDRSKTKNSVRSIALTSMLLAILIIQEELLVFIPNVQLTVILIIVYAQFLSDKELYPLVLAYVILDSLLMGSLSLLYTPAMLFSWTLLALVSKRLKHKPDYVKLIIAICFAFVYGWSFIPFTAIVQNFSTWNQVFRYFYFDLPFEAIMAVNSLITYLIFYLPLTKLFKKLYKQVDNTI